VDVARFAAHRERWFPDEAGTRVPSARPELAGVRELELELDGTPVGVGWPASVVDVLVDGVRVGEIRDHEDGFEHAVDVTALPAAPPAVGLLPRDEGSWFVPRRADWIARAEDGRRRRVATWTTGDPGAAEGERGVRLVPRWCEPENLPPVTASFAGEAPDASGALATWSPGSTAPAPSGFTLRLRQAREFVWAKAVSDDPRLLRDPRDPEAAPRAACWFDLEAIELEVVPPDTAPYRLTLHLLDYDRAGRHQRVTVRRRRAVLDARDFAADAIERGAHPSWTVTGPVTIRVENVEGANAVLSSVRVDRE
jgi:hypothetical protein